jgi:hypothetical protein
MFVTALALFSVASLGGGLAPTSLTLVIARLLRAGALRCARPGRGARNQPFPALTGQPGCDSCPAGTARVSPR